MYNNKKVNVVVPAYNEESLIVKTLSSIPDFVEKIIVVNDFSITKFTPEALHRTVEAYYEMGMLEESNNVASVLGYNYPNSKWYRYSYNLIKKSNKENSFFDKVKQIF